MIGFKVTFAASFTGLVLADLGQIKKDLALAFNVSDRAVMGQVPDFLKPGFDGFNNQYGCWCSFSDPVVKGHGEPQSDLDASCKDLHMGYECARMDEELCIAHEVAYTSILTTLTLTGNNYLEFIQFVPTMEGKVRTDLMEQDCTANNAGDQCAIYACIIEANFVVSAYFYTFAAEVNGVDDQNVYHINGFNAETQCVVKGPSGGDKACCGSYPTRFPYGTKNGLRKCCGNKTYDDSILQCCDAATSSVATACEPANGN